MVLLARLRQAFVPGFKPSRRQNSTTTWHSQHQDQQLHSNNMSFDQRPDQLLSEPPMEEPPSIPATNGERTAESAEIYSAPLPPAPVDETSRAVDDVLYSDVGKDSNCSLQNLPNTNATSDRCEHVAEQTKAKHCIRPSTPPRHLESWWQILNDD